MSKLTPPSQIAQRQLAYFEGKHVLIAGEAEDDFALELIHDAASVSLFTTHFGYYQKLNKHPEVECFFGANYQEFQPTHQPDLILFYFPKAKAETEFLLAMLFACLGKGTEICVVGENRSGIKSIEKMFNAYGPITKYDSARRCSFYWGQCDHDVKPFVLDDWFKTYELTLEQEKLTVKSLPGVFSHGEFDLGSKLLLENLPALKGKCLDFGCGAGVIGSMMAKRFPNAEVEMCDVSALAVASSRETLKANQLKASVFATDIYSQASSDYQFIISNPPFHSGLDTSYNATETLISDAPKHLKKGGQFCIVANNFLKYPPLIQASLGQCQTLAKTNKFSIYHAQKV